MIKKLQVIVREVYEVELMEEKIKHNKTGEAIDSWDFKKLTTEEQANYTFGEYPTGKSKIEEREGDPVFGQVFQESDLNVKDLILHLNRTK